ncbi:MAG: GNAT family N-acetyltransferase [Alphaproteobacteria bacterium]|nr:GNAT family N-acetyltransferase [Alphaproteobacteria bacterium]
MSAVRTIGGAHLSMEQRQECLILLVDSFVQDRGMATLWGDPETAVDRASLGAWFRATVQMLGWNDGAVIAVCEGDEIVGVAILAGEGGGSRIVRFIGWIARVAIGCGFGVVQRTAVHDRARNRYRPDTRHVIVEFICVSAQKRGQGLGRYLFAAIHDANEPAGRSFWLETTKKENISIFGRFGYQLKEEYEDLGVTNFTMLKEP